MALSESQGENDLQSDTPRSEVTEPTTIKVRTEGLKLDLVLIQNRISGLTIDYQNISSSGELQRWIEIIDAMISEKPPTSESRVNSQVETNKLPSEKPRLSKQGGEVQPKEIPIEPAVDVLVVSPIEPPARPPKEEAPALEPPTRAVEGVSNEVDTDNDYREIVVHAVDISLDTLGRDGKHAVLSLLENRHGLREQDVPDHPLDFVMLLEEILGASSQTLEREIITNIRTVSNAAGENLEEVIASLKALRKAEASEEKRRESHTKNTGSTGFRYDATYVRGRGREK